MKLKLPDNISSSQDIANLLIELQQYSRWLAHTNIMKRVDLNKSVEPPTISADVKELMKSWNDSKQLDQTSLSSLTTELTKFKDNAPHINITLAGPPTNDIKRTLVVWFRQNLEPNILVTFQFNATILGGMVVRYGSRIFDWSFRRQILASRQKFPEVLRRV